MTLPFTLGDVVRTHLKSKQTTLTAALLGAQPEHHMPEERLRVLMNHGYKNSLPSNISEWLASAIGETQYYWRKVNKRAAYVSYMREGFFTNKTMDLYALKAWVYNKAEAPSVRIDTEISAKTVLGTLLLEMKEFEMTIQGKAHQQKLRFFLDELDSDLRRVFWLILRKWSVQENRQEETVFTVEDGYQAERCTCCGYKFANIYFKFTVDSTEAWIQPFRSLVENTGGQEALILKWNKDFVDLMSMEVLNATPEIYNGVCWKDYI